MRQIRITPRGGTPRDVTELVRTESISGNVGQCARELSLALLASGGNWSQADLAKGSLVQHLEDGVEVFRGTIVGRSHTSGGATLDLTALDYGWQLSGNEGYYSFRGTPEAAAATLCRDFGIPIGQLARTGVSVARKFPGVPLHQIIDTMYTKAAETTGGRYLLRFQGAALSVVEKPKTAGDRVLAPSYNLMSTTVTEDVSKLCTSVEIRNSAGGIVRRVDEAGALAAYGLFRHVITQKKKGDAVGEAREFLRDHGEHQTVTVECLGDLSLITGNAVMLRAAGAGVSGLFWIDGDTHTWKNGQYFTRLTLNFRNLMNDTDAGGEL